MGAKPTEDVHQIQPGEDDRGDYSINAGRYALDSSAQSRGMKYVNRPDGSVVNMDDIDFKQSRVKPQYSYATLIQMAMTEAGEKITLGEIYSWITSNFLYYKNAKPSSWQNAIRHNLSLNKKFMKVARHSSEAGKGSYWALNPDSDQNKGNNSVKRLNPYFNQDVDITAKRSNIVSAPISPV